MMLLFSILFLFLIGLSLSWVNGIDNMKQNHPDYKGQDFLEWDDNKQHTEDI